MNLLSGSGRLFVGELQPGLFDNMSVTSVAATDVGYVIVYVDNQTMGEDVWFDDVQVLHYNTQVLEENHYYPFGLTVSNSSMGTTPQPLKYNGKELEKSFGLEWYSYGAREYDPQIGRFPTIDRFAGNFASMSPYHYASNNPISNIDINGDSTWTTTNIVKNANGTNTTTYTTHLTGKVLDLAGVKIGGGCNIRSGTRELARDINSSFNKQRTMNQLPNGNQEIWNFDVNYTEANSMSDVSASDHLLVVVDDVTGTADPELGGGPAGGLAERNGKISYVQNSSDFYFLVDNSVHEIGHNMGQGHDKNGSGNYMSYDQQRNKFSGIQIMQMFNSSRNGVLNQGSNNQRSIISTNNWFYNTSSNKSPWLKNTSIGDVIPKILNNK